jgi:hypothetical protein
MLLDFVIHCRQDETQSWESAHVKTVCVHSVVSHGRMMQYACGSVTLASPLIYFQGGSYNNNSLGTFWCMINYCDCKKIDLEPPEYEKVFFILLCLVYMFEKFFEVWIDLV